MKNSELQDLYHKFNKKWFGNRLPKDMVVRYERMYGDDAPEAATKFGYGRPLFIILNARLKWSESQSAMTLLHEMVHVELPFRFNHGPRFHNRMIQLARAGAFKPWW